MYSEDDLVNKLSRISFEEMMLIYYANKVFTGDDCLICFDGGVAYLFSSEIDLFIKHGWTYQEYVKSGGEIL